MIEKPPQALKNIEYKLKQIILLKDSQHLFNSTIETKIMQKNTEQSKSNHYIHFNKDENFHRFLEKKHKFKDI